MDDGISLVEYLQKCHLKFQNVGSSDGLRRTIRAILNGDQSPTIFERFHCFDVGTVSFSSPHNKSRGVLRLNESAMSTADAVTVNSEPAKKDLIEGLNDDQRAAVLVLIRQYREINAQR